MLMVAVVLLAAWLVLSVLVSLLLGAMCAVGRGPLKHSAAPVASVASEPSEVADAA